MNSLKYTCHALLLALPLMGCVAENASVVIHGVIDPTTDDCSNPTSAVSFLPGTGVDVSLLYAYSSWLNVRNYATTESPWQSSGGGSSSGSALDPAIPNRNTVFINTVIFSCIEINGSASACKGAREIRKTTGNMPIPPNGAANIPFTISFSELANWGVAGDVTLGISVAYHDTGVIKGTSSQTVFRLADVEFDPNCKPDESGKITIKAPSTCAIYGQDSAPKWCSEPAPPPNTGGGGTDSGNNT